MPHGGRRDVGRLRSAAPAPLRPPCPGAPADTVHGRGARRGDPVRNDAELGESGFLRERDAAGVHREWDGADHL